MAKVLFGLLAGSPSSGRIHRVICYPKRVEIEHRLHLSNSNSTHLNKNFYERIQGIQGNVNPNIVNVLARTPEKIVKNR